MLGALVVAAVLGWPSLQPTHAAECSTDKAGKIAVERTAEKWCRSARMGIISSFGFCWRGESTTE